MFLLNIAGVVTEPMYRGEHDSRVIPHPIYTHLGKTLDARLEAYRRLIETQMHTDELTRIHNAWQTGTPLGNHAFKQTIASKLKCKVGHDKRGLPKRALTLTITTDR